MTNEEIIRNIRYLAKKHQDDTVLTFETNFHVAFTDIANHIEEQAEENTRLRTENERLNTGLDTLISKIKDHSNTEKVSTAKPIKRKHAYYRAISVTKVIKFINELKKEAAEYE